MFFHSNAKTWFTSKAPCIHRGLFFSSPPLPPPPPSLSSSPLLTGHVSAFHDPSPSLPSPSADPPTAIKSERWRPAPIVTCVAYRRAVYWCSRGWWCAPCRPPTRLATSPMPADSGGGISSSAPLLWAYCITKTNDRTKCSLENVKSFVEIARRLRIELVESHIFSLWFIFAFIFLRFLWQCSLSAKKEMSGRKKSR